MFSSFFFFFLLIITMCGLLTGITLCDFISKFHWIVCISFSRIHSGLYVCYLFVWSNFNHFGLPFLPSHVLFYTPFTLACFIRLLLLLLIIRVIHISDIWWSFTGDWVTASLLKSPGLFKVFWSFSIMLLFGWSPLDRQPPNLPGPLIIL